MPWCPKCKNEYRAGITVCPDCKETLVEELTEDMEDFVSLFQTTDEELKNKLVKYLIHCEHKVKEESGIIETEEGKQLVYVILCPKKSAAEALQEIRTVLSYDAKQEAGETDLKPRRRAPQPSTVYVDAKSRYEEYKSTGIMFLVFSVAFAVFGILNICGIVNFMASTLSLVLIFTAAVAFLGIGISSLRRTASLKEEASTEEQTTENIMDYLKENFTKEKLLAEINEEITGELLYFQLMETMKERAMQKFPEADENYLDALLEEHYNSLGI